MKADLAVKRDSMSMMGSLILAVLAMALSSVPAFCFLFQDRAAAPKTRSKATPECYGNGAAYHPYYVVATSGPDKDKVLSRGKEIAEKLKATLLLDPEKDLEHLPTVCSQEASLMVGSGNCLLFVNSKNYSDIGPYTWTAGSPDLNTIYYAVIYDVRNGYRDANRKASALLAKVRLVAKDAYKKRLTNCVTE